MQAKKKILDLELTEKQANTTDSDFKAEIIAADLIEQGFDPERIMIIREGGAKRGYSKDIEEVQLHYSQYDLLDYLHIKANKEGIYDILPEGIFHQTTSKKFNKDKEDILDEIKLHREEEFFARKFFQLFEVEVDHTLIDAYLYEAKYDKKITNQNFVNIFLFYWPVLRLLPHRQAILFMHTIPILNKVRNRYNEVEEAISLILGTPVRIGNIKLPAKDAGSFFESKIGDNYLGIDWVLGKYFDDGKYDLKVTVGPISAKEMENFLETATGNEILDTLCKLFLPGDAFIVKEFKIIPEDSIFILSNENQISYLGINTFI